MATKAQIIADYNNQRGCLFNLKDDEEGFILQSGDVFAAELVGLWAERVREAAHALPVEVVTYDKDNVATMQPHPHRTALLMKADEAKAWSVRALNYAGRKLPANPLSL